MLDADLRLPFAGVDDRLAHCHIGICGGIAHETAILAIDVRIEIDLRHAGHMAAQPELCILWHGANAGTAVHERIAHGERIVAEAGNDATAGAP